MCYICYRGRAHWLGGLLKCCAQLPPSEVEARVGCCASGQVATIVALFGSRKQLSIFPESIATLSKSTTSVMANGTVETPLHKQERIRDTSQKSVGHVLGNTLGFDEPDEETEAEKEIRYSFKQTHKDEVKRDSSLGGDNSPGSETKQVESTCTSTCRKAQSAAEYQSSASTVSGGVGSVDPRVLQLSGQLEVWMERLADGSLRRYTVEVWPEWDGLTR